MTKHSDSGHQARADNVDKPVPNRRERRGNKTGTPSHRGGKLTLGRTQGRRAEPREYSMRRRGG